MNGAAASALGLWGLWLARTPSLGGLLPVFEIALKGDSLPLSPSLGEGDAGSEQHLGRWL
jgi:hypothetical protein